jgi:ADP-heptose:LPS heptosyltransferase
MMNVDTLRLVDRFLGLPLCWLFTSVRWLGRAFNKAKSLPTPQRVLIIKLSEMGSTVLAYPALAELKKRCPGVELFFLVFKNNSAIVEALDIIPPGNIITVDMSSVSRLVASGTLALWRLLRERIDTSIDMDFFSRLAALIGFIVCRGNRVGFHRYTSEGLSRGNLLTHRVLYSPHVHTAAAFMYLVLTLFDRPEDEPHYRGSIGVDQLVVPKYTPLAAEIESVRNKLRLTGALPEMHPLILINPNSSDIFPLRRWPMENFAELCKRVLKIFPSGWLVITGVASEASDALYLTERVANPRLVDFTGKTTFRELLALYSIANLMVTNDSGPAHFASVLDLPTIVLFGPETPRLYSPLGGKHRDLYSEFACSPCVSVYNGKKSPCLDNRCLKAITVDAVVGQAMTLLNNSERRDQEPAVEICDGAMRRAETIHPTPSISIKPDLTTKKAKVT